MKKGSITICVLFLCHSLTFCTGLNSGEWMFTAKGNDTLDSDIKVINPDDRAGDNLSAMDQLNLDSNQAWFDGLESTSMSLDEAIASWLGISIDTLSIASYAKVEEPDTSAAAALYIDYNAGSNSGDWATYNDPDTSGPAINFYTVKGGNEFAIYRVDPAASSGTWSTENLLNGSGKKIPTMSHITAFTPAPVPEPATLILLMMGLLGFSLLKKKKR